MNATLHSETAQRVGRQSLFAMTAWCMLAAYSVVFALPLENWRLPFFMIASDFELSNGAPSGMFWDGIESAALFDSTLWVGEEPTGKNRWRIEPAITGGGTLPKPSTWETPFSLHGDLYHEARYRLLRIGQALDVDTRYEYDEYYPAHRERFVRGRIEEAFLQLDWRNGFVNIGRKQRSWGPFPDRSLILSANPYSYDAVEWRFSGRFFEFRHLFAPFSVFRSGWDSDNGEANDRYLTAHSLNLFFGKWATVGITESVLFTRRGSFPDLQYINPVSIYSVVNTNQEGAGNLMLGFQWNIHPAVESISLRGQVVFDDFQVDDELVTDREPAHWGIDAGIFWRDPVRALPLRHLLKLEFTYASPWLYTVSDENAGRGERYIYGGKSLGLPFTDGSRLRLGAMAVPGRFGAYGITLSMAQRGGNTELTSWRDADHIPGLPFDTHAPVERRFAIGAEGCFYYKDYMHFYGYGDLGWMRNRDNRLTEGYEFDPAVAIEASVHFSDFSIRLP
ncbi:MAG: hypothetical protein JW913_04315 [Chitinispirillaceae bacterium]|nr:hypothetical protein [Chitinispirillaceae bacterium]